MVSRTYTLKLSPQGQLTLPRQLREELGLELGSNVAVTATFDGKLAVAAKPPIAARFGNLAGAWTTASQDATDYVRELRDDMQPKQP